MTRAFRLRNASGDVIDLLADLDIFGVSPEGLGVSFEHTSHLSNSNYLLEKSELHQNEFKLSVVFGYISHDPYNSYYKLVQFLDKAPYKLEYETPAGTWQREVRLKELTKTEIVTGDVMMEDFTLSCFTPWYRNVESKYDPDIDTPGDGKIYIEYKSTAILKKLNAFAYSADGTEGFTTEYPNENLLEEIIPYGTDHFHFGSNDTTAWNEIKNNTIRIGATQSGKYAQNILFSDPATWGGLPNLKPTVALRNLTVGAEYTLSTRFRYTGAIGETTRFGIELRSHNKDGVGINVMAKDYVYLKNVGEGKRTKLVITGTVPEGFYDNIKSVTLAFNMISDTDSTKSEGFVEFDNIKLEAGSKATGATALPDLSIPNMVEELKPYGKTNKFTFSNGGDTTSGVTLLDDSVTIKGTGKSNGRGVLCFSNPELWTINRVPAEQLQKLKPGKQYTIGARFRPQTAPTADNKIYVQCNIERKTSGSVRLLNAIVDGSKLVKGQSYYLDGLTIPIPEDIYNEDLRSVTLKLIFDGPGECVIDKLTMYEGDQRFANNGLPTYIGEREVTGDFLPNVNLVTRKNIFPIETVSGTMDFSSWMGDGQFIFNKAGNPNDGIYLMSKHILKRNVEYSLHLELRDPINGLRNLFIYNPFNGEYTSSTIIDGEPVTLGFGKAYQDIYWVADQNNPEEVDYNWHTVDITFNLSDSATIEWYEGIIAQPDKGLSRKINVEFKHVMLTEGPYPGYYTQEERPEFYKWSRLEGKWAPPTPDGRDYNLTYDNEVFDYDYYQAPATRGPGMHAYAYDYTYEGWANGANGVFSINNESIYMNTQSGSPVEIFIDGPSKNPYWEVVRNGEILASDGFNITIAAGYRLVVSSVPGEQRAELIAPDGTKSNVYQQQRLELTNFVKVPSGYSQLIFHNTKSVSFNLREEKVVV